MADRLRVYNIHFRNNSDILKHDVYVVASSSTTAIDLAGQVILMAYGTAHSFEVETVFALMYLHAIEGMPDYGGIRIARCG
jgi:hypothetical protein